MSARFTVESLGQLAGEIAKDGDRSLLVTCTAAICERLDMLVALEAAKQEKPAEADTEARDPVLKWCYLCGGKIDPWSECTIPMGNGRGNTSICGTCFNAWEHGRTVKP